MKAEDFLTQEMFDKLQEEVDDNNGMIDAYSITKLMEEYHQAKLNLLNIN